MADPAPAPSGAGTPKDAPHAQPELRVVKDDPAEGSAAVAVPPSRGPGLLENSRSVLAPPDLLHTQPPSVQQLWDRARDARHLPNSAGLKAAATAYVVVVAAPGIIASILYWALAHPARGAVLALVSGCVTVITFLTFSAL